MTKQAHLQRRLWHRGMLLALLAGAAVPVGLAQPQQPPQEGVPPNKEDTAPIKQPINPAQKAAETPAKRRAREALEQRNREQNERRRKMMDNAMEGQTPDEAAIIAAQQAAQANQPNRATPPGIQMPGNVMPPPGASGPLNPNDQPLPEGAIAHLEGDGLIRLNFGAESVSLDAFVDYVSQVLRINITPDPAIAQQQIMFRAPIEIPKEQLLPLLAAIVEDKGFALVEDPVLGYFIRSASAVPVEFDGDGDFLTTRIIRTPMIRPSAVQASLQPLTGTAPANLRFSPMDDLGVLIVTGPPRAVENVERFVDRLLDEIAGQSLHKFQLMNVEAGYARSRVLTLNGKLGGIAAPAVPGGGGGGGGAGALANLDSRLIIDQGNCVIFRGTSEESLQVGQLFTMVDVVTPLISRRYSAGSVASDVATAGEREGLGPVVQSNAGSSGSTGFAPARPGLLAPGGAGASTSEATVNTSGFTVDDAGTIIYTGTEQQHARVKALVESFTEHIKGSRVDIKRYKLHNAEAESVADLLTQLIEDESLQTGTGTSPFLPASRVQGQRASRPSQTIEPLIDAPDAEASASGEDGAQPAASSAPVEISIVADPDRNQILVKAPARQQAEIEQIIKQLDERRPQVYVEAQIVAINTTKNFDWTVETQINAGQFLLFSNFGLSTAGTAPPGGQAAQGPRIVPTNRTGLTSAVIKSDFVPYILNTLASKTDSKIISNPRILVNDNETADLRSEREEPFATTTQGTATTTTGQGGVATAGTSLSVTPRISKGGYISLEYQIELSDFVGAPVAGLQPPTQREQFNSIVTIPSDSTIIVGGFNLTRRSETDSGIPILKDIPIIGMLFKSINLTDRRTTIFVFITPRIMTDPNFIDLRLASEGPIDKAEVKDITPELKPVTVRIEDQASAPDRLVPANEAPSGP